MLQSMEYGQISHSFIKYNEFGAVTMYGVWTDAHPFNKYNEFGAENQPCFA